MRRRAVLWGLAGAIAGGAAPAAAQALRGEISQLWSRVQQLELAGDLQGARTLALQLARFSQRDPGWYRYPESFSIAATLLRLTSPGNRAEYLFAAVGVVRCWVAADQEGLLSSWMTIGTAAETVLQAAGSTRLEPNDLATAAPLLLTAAGTTSGAQRGSWARQGLAAIKRYPSDFLDESWKDPKTVRFFAAAMGAAGDWTAAARQYDRLLSQPEALLGGGAPARNPFAGVADILTAVSAVQREAATAFAMSGQLDRAMRMLEAARRPTRETAEAATRSPDPVALEQQLTKRNTVIVQPVVTLVGAFAVCSRIRGATTRRFVAFDPDPGGVELFSRIFRSSTKPPADGLVPLYDSLRRYADAGQPARYRRFVDMMWVMAEWFLGPVLREVLARAAATSQDDVLIIPPAELGLLPVSACRDLRGSKSLAAQYRVRYAPSLASAVAAAQRVERAYAGTATAAQFGGGRSAKDLAFQPFEIACVASHFGRKPQVGLMDLKNADGSGYWHVAGHAAWDYRRPAASGLRLSAARLTTMEDIRSLRLSAPPRLVFLSACETALLDVSGDLNRYSGLATAFLDAGAAGVIGSLWQVEDAATAFLAVRFYDAHIVGGLPPAAALREAQIWLSGATPRDLRNYVTDQVVAGRCTLADAAPLVAEIDRRANAPIPFLHPYYWSGFELFGA